MDTTWVQDTLARLIAAAERAYTAQTGGASVCQIQKDGRVTGGVKYAEGRFVALGKARRLILTAGNGAELAAYRAAVEAELGSWRAALQSRQSTEHPAIPWVAYYQGGIDALEAFRELLAAERTPGDA